MGSGQGDSGGVLLSGRFACFFFFFVGSSKKQIARLINRGLLFDWLEKRQVLDTRCAVSRLNHDIGETL